MAQADTRQWLVQADHAASRDFDRAIMTLSAAALGFSVAFLGDDATRPQHTGWLAAAWINFALSLVLITVSFLTSQRALRWEIQQLDAGPSADNAPGGRWGAATSVLNLSSATALFVGVVALVVFALYNI